MLSPRSRAPFEGSRLPAAAPGMATRWAELSPSRGSQSWAYRATAAVASGWRISKGACRWCTTA